MALRPSVVYTVPPVCHALRLLMRIRESATSCCRRRRRTPHIVLPRRTFTIDTGRGHKATSLIRQCVQTSEERWAMGDRAGALEAMNQAVSIDTMDPELWGHMGTLFLHVNRIDEAIEAFDKAISIHPVYASAYVYRGVCRERKGDMEGAKNDFKKATKVDVDLTLAYERLGFLLLDEGQRPKRDPKILQEALDVFRQALMCEDNTHGTANSRYGMGLAYIQLEKYTEASEAFQDALRADPTFAPGYHGLGDAMQLRGEYKDAIGAYSNFLEAFSGYSNSIVDPSARATSEPLLGDALFKRGVCWYNVEEWWKAAEDFTAALDTPHFLHKHFGFLRRSRCFMKLHKWEKALYDLNRSIEIHSGIPEAYACRSECFTHLGLHDEADRDRILVERMYDDTRSG